MSTVDRNAYRAQQMAGVGALARLGADTVRGHGMPGAASARTGRLNAKAREVIALGAAVTLRRDGYIVVHTEAARKLGATPEKFEGSFGSAVSVNAGAAIVCCAHQQPYAIT